MRKTILWLIAALLLIPSFGYAQSCSSAGQKEYRSSGACGTDERTCCPMLNTWSGWNGSCPSCQCSPGSTQSCGGGNGSQSCNSSCTWGSCSCNDGYTWDGSTCKQKECTTPKPSETQACGNCGKQTRTVTCNYTTGNWDAGSWGTCGGQGVCKPGTTQSCDINSEKTCFSSCTWSTYCSCTNTFEKNRYLSAGNGYWSEKFCSGVCCDATSWGIEAARGMICYNGRFYTSAVVCGALGDR